MIEFVKCDSSTRCCLCYYQNKQCSNKQCTGDHRGYYVQVPNKPKANKVDKRVVEVVVEREMGNVFNFFIKSLGIKGACLYGTRSSAARGARLFCKKIGAECEIEE